MPLRLVELRWVRKVQPVADHRLLLAVSFQTSMVPLGGSDFYGEQHLGVELDQVRVLKVDGYKLDFRKHHVASEYFLWEEHANEIAQRVLEKLLEGRE